MPGPDGSLHDTVEKLNRVGTSCSRCPTKDLPSPPSTAFTTRDIFIHKIANIPCLLSVPH